MDEINKLIEVVRKLRDPNSGCPWDIKQTSKSKCSESKALQAKLCSGSEALEAKLYKQSSKIKALKAKL